MGKYTRSKLKGHDLDRFVEEKLNVVVESIKEEIPDLKSIILMGGYGRGEGAVDIHKGKPRLINDFDMYVITERQLSDVFLEEVAMRCSKLIGKGGIAHPEGFEQRYDFEKFFHVDIRCLPESKLSNLPPTVRYFEMRNSSTVLYGNKNILKKFPDITAEEIPKSEALRLIMNRMMLLLMSFSPDFRKNGMTPDEKGIMNYYIAKSYLTMAEALLIISRDFVPSYLGRAKIFPRIYRKKFPGLYNKMPDLASRVSFYTSYKTNPNSKGLNTLEEWFKCREYLGEIFKYTLSKIIPGPVQGDWTRIAALMKKELGRHYFSGYMSYMLNAKHMDNQISRRMACRLAQAYMSMKYFSRLREKAGLYWRAFRPSDPGLRILWSTPLVLYSIRRNGKTDREMMEMAYSELKGVYPMREGEDWNRLRDDYLKPYSIYYLQRFV